MTAMELKIKALDQRIGNEIPAPRYATPGAAAMDLCACLDTSVTIPAGERCVVPTGIAIALPDSNHVALLFARSGLGIKKGICLANGVGVIDSDYARSDNEGHIFLRMTNDNREGKGLRVPAGTAFAQGIFLPFGVTIDDDVQDIRNGGFGSTTRG